MTFRTDFPDFPEGDFPALPEGFVDTSFCKDACPSMCSYGFGLMVYVDYRDPNKRELPPGSRFVVLGMKGSFVDIERPLLETDNWDAVLALVAQRSAR